MDAALILHSCAFIHDFNYFFLLLPYLFCCPFIVIVVLLSLVLLGNQTTVSKHLAS